MTNADVMRYMIHHQQQLRNAVPYPSEETQAIWRAWDAKQQFLLHCSEQEEAAARAKAEAEEDYTFSITSEVKLK